VDLKLLVGKKRNLKYVEAFKSKRRMSKNRYYNVVHLGLLVESIFSNLIFLTFEMWCGIYIYIFVFGEGGGKRM
jgi:hypothetical protein